MKLKRMTNPDCIFVTASLTKQDTPTEDVTRAHLLRGHRDPPAHYLIENCGRLVIGRTTSQPGCLAGDYNSHSIQVCLIGGLDSALTPSDTYSTDQIDSLVDLRGRWGLPVVFDPMLPPSLRERFHEADSASKDSPQPPSPVPAPDQPAS